MEKTELLKKLELTAKDGFSSEKEFITCLDIIEKLNEADLTKNEKFFIKKSTCNINILYIQFLIKKTPEDDYENLLHLRGKLIKLYKTKEKISKDSNEKMAIRKTYLEELKKHREILRVYKRDNTKKIPVSKKLALTVKDISKTIEIFMNEKDILNKVKRIVKDTGNGVTCSAVIAMIISFAFCHFSNIPITTKNILSIVASCAPAAAYIGLSSLIRNIGSKTEFQDYLDKTSAEYKNLINTFQMENKDLIGEINELKQVSSKLFNDDKIKLNNKIINKIKILIDRTEVIELKEGFELEIIGLLRENKDIREKVKDNYLEGLANDKEIYDRNNKELKKLNIELFMKENSIKEAFKQSGSNLVVSMVVILMAKALLSAVAPGVFAINGISSIGIPILISAINGLLNVPTYGNKRKLKDTEYDEKKREREKEEIMKMLGSQSRNMRLA